MGRMRGFIFEGIWIQVWHWEGNRRNNGKKTWRERITVFPASQFQQPEGNLGKCFLKHNFFSQQKSHMSVYDGIKKPLRMAYRAIFPKRVRYGWRPRRKKELTEFAGAGMLMVHPSKSGVIETAGSLEGIGVKLL